MVKITQNIVTGGFSVNPKQRVCSVTAIPVQCNEIQAGGLFFHFRAFEYFMDVGFVFPTLLVCNVSVGFVKFKIYIGIQGWRNLVSKALSECNIKQAQNRTERVKLLSARVL